MADKEKTEQTSNEEEQKQEESPEIASAETLDAHEAFDAKMDADDDDDKGGDEKTDDSGDEKNTADDKGTDEKDSGDEKKDEEGEQLSDELLQRAEAVGISKEDATAVGNPKALEASVSILESRSQKQDDDKKEGDEKDGDSKGGDKSADKGDEEDKPYDCGLDPKEWEPELIESLNKQGQQQQDTIKELRKDVEGLKGELASERKSAGAREAEAFTEQFDGMVSGLGDDFADELGKGTIDDLDANSQEYKNRVAVQDKMIVLANGYASSKKGKPPSVQGLFEEAVQLVFPNKKAAVAVKEVSKKAKARASQSIGRGADSGRKKTGSDKALDANIEFDKKLDEDD